MKFSLLKKADFAPPMDRYFEKVLQSSGEHLGGYFEPISASDGETLKTPTSSTTRGIVMSNRNALRRFTHSPSLEKTTNSPLAVLKQFTSAQYASTVLGSLEATAILGQVTIQEFYLGDRLLSFTPPKFTETSAIPYENQTDCYLVCDGRVRLLCRNVYSERLVTASVLEPGEMFGADHLLAAMPLPYVAIAASPGCLVRIAHQELTALLEQLPRLRTYLSQMVEQREQMVFFKRFTQLQSLPCHTLKTLVLPRLVEQQIKAGESLAEATPASTGHFWLRAGQVHSQTSTSTPLSSGDSWGYPDPVPDDWVAATDLRVYQLPLEPWEILTTMSRRENGGNQ
jgi:CRP-like cAMP-binding protein